MHMLGADVLVVTGTCRGLEPRSATGDLALIEDHINLLGESPLVGPNLDELGPRFPDLSEAYAPGLRDAAAREAAKRRIGFSRGIYAAVRSSSLENPRERDWLRWVGADFAGTAIVPEVIVARHMGMKVLGIGVVANPELGHDRWAGRVSHGSGPDLSALIAAVVQEMTPSG
jgi:purine-nucleoside phosphorylase